MLPRAESAVLVKTAPPRMRGAAMRPKPKPNGGSLPPPSEARATGGGWVADTRTVIRNKAKEVHAAPRGGANTNERSEPILWRQRAPQAVLVAIRVPFIMAHRLLITPA